MKRSFADTFNPWANVRSSGKAEAAAKTAQRVDALHVLKPYPCTPAMIEGKREQALARRAAAQGGGGGAAAAAAPPPAPDAREPCRYGAACYRKHPEHLTQFAHPGDAGGAAGAAGAASAGGAAGAGSVGAGRPSLPYPTGPAHETTSANNFCGDTFCGKLPGLAGDEYVGVLGDTWSFPDEGTYCAPHPFAPSEGVLRVLSVAFGDPLPTGEVLGNAGRGEITTDTFTLRYDPAVLAAAHAAQATAAEAAAAGGGGGGAAAHTPCSYSHGHCEDGTAATHFCSSCGEHLCAQCHGAHATARGTKKHHNERFLEALLAPGAPPCDGVNTFAFRLQSHYRGSPTRMREGEDLNAIVRNQDVGCLVVAQLDPATGTATVAIPHDEDWGDWWSMVQDQASVDSPLFNQFWEKYQRSSAPEGVVWRDGAVPPALCAALNAGIDALAAATPEPDYHPHSGGVVRDHVHPALYHYVKGATLLALEPPKPPKPPPCKGTFECGYAASSRSECHGCQRYIAQDTLRIGKHERTDLGGGRSAMASAWHHKACFMRQRGEGFDGLCLATPIKGMGALRPEDQTALRKALAEREARDAQSDAWGRGYEDSAHQWLPTYFDVSADGAQCTIRDYINNIVPRAQHESLYGSLAELFLAALPALEGAYSYSLEARARILPRPGGEFAGYGGVPVNEEDGAIAMATRQLRGCSLQVITKVVDYEFGDGDAFDGVWHVEGMSHENIVATCDFVLARDDAIEGGEILFKRAFYRDEGNRFIESMPQCRVRRLDEVVYEGMVPLGRVPTPQGRLICFPNSHVHRVKKLSRRSAPEVPEAPAATKARRRIVVFWLVDPSRRIVSTREVPPQQQRAGGAMALAEAKEHRLRLMEERKHHKQNWNVRTVSLCEH